MAIDTAEERRSASGVPYLPLGVTPNAAKDIEWRQQVSWGYSGIQVQAAGINTAQKRRCAAGLPYLPLFSITPDAGKGKAWRQTAGWGYCGIATGSGGVVVVIVRHEGLRRNVGRMMR